MPGKDGLLHISEIDWKRLETVEEGGEHPFSNSFHNYLLKTSV